MRTNKYGIRFLAIAVLLLAVGSAWGGDLAAIKKAGVLQHLGIPYANFVSGSGDGMDVEIMQKFSAHLGVRYEYVKTDWDTVVEDLIGRKVKARGPEVEFLEAVPVKGDLIANGFTIIPWRQKAVEFSTPTFPSQIWLIARSDSRVRPIKPSKSIEADIQGVRALMQGKNVMALRKTCLDPDLYKLEDTGAKVTCFNGKLNELAPAVINGESEMTILDVPDALVALQKWPGKLKIIGPVSPKQEMAVAFPKTSPELKDEFNAFLKQMIKDGTYRKIVKKYYPAVFEYYPEFFKNK